MKTVRKCKTAISTKFIIFTVCAIFVFSPLNVLACTIFIQSDEDKVLVGNNEDFYYSYASMYWIVRSDNEFSRICFGNSTYIQGGMNEKGLFYDGATCPKSKVPYDENKETIGMNIGDIILSKCATVKEAIEFLRSYNIISGYSDHLLLADSLGNAAVVEWLEDEMKVIWSENNRLIATNFFLSNTKLGGYPCNRYSTVEDALNESSSPDLETFSKILENTSQNFEGGGTKYSNIYDLKTLTVYVYEKVDFSNIAIINLANELEKSSIGIGIPIDISTLNYQPASLIYNGMIIDTEEINEVININDNSLNNDDINDIALNHSGDKDFDFPLILVVSFIIISVSGLYFLHIKK